MFSWVCRCLNLFGIILAELVRTSRRTRQGQAFSGRYGFRCRQRLSHSLSEHACRENSHDAPAVCPVHGGCNGFSAVVPIRFAGRPSRGGPAFDWDIAIDVGDFSDSQTPPVDHEGLEVVRQYAAATKHRREDFYDLAGNHDASGPGKETQWWFRKWIAPTGENTKFSGVDPKRRRYPVCGTWEWYSFRVGNLLFLMMSDRNDGGPPVGRGKKGGYPAGAVTGETFD
jgi:hypothetical protein